MFTDDNYGQLGDISNSVMYAGQLLGCFTAVFVMAKIGDRKTMTLGAALSIFFISSILLPAYKSMNLESNSWYFNTAFVYVVIIVLSFINGYG